VVRVLTLIVLLLLVACGPTPAPSTPQTIDKTAEVTVLAPEGTAAPMGTTVPTEVGETVWENPYQEIPAQLCPPVDADTRQPTFGDPRQEGELWLQRGLIANDQAELFSMVVAGLDPATVGEYTSQVKVCFDMIPGDGAAGESAASPPVEEVPAGDELGPEDLFIAVYLVASTPPKEAPDPFAVAQNAIQELSPMPVTEWASWLKSNGWTAENAEQGYVLDFVVDPTIGSVCCHQYIESWGNRGWVMISVAGGGGSVTAGLCKNRNTTPVSKYTVTKRATPEATVISNYNGATTIYDFGVRGRQSSNTYRVSGRWGYAGWNVGYATPQPPGSRLNCNP